MRALVLPILVPLSTAAILLLAPKRPLLQRWIALSGSILLLGSAVVVFRRVDADGIQVLQISGWPAPFGITLVADLLAAMLVVAVGVVGVAVTAAAFAGVDPRREAFGYHPLIQILLMGVSGAFLTGDLFNLYVWFEVMLVASFVLMALHRTSAQVEAAFKYVTINLIASSIFLTALGLLYGVAGTLNMADLARIWPTMRTPGIDTGAGGAVRDRVQHQGRTVPAVLLAAGLVSHAAGGHRRGVRRTADEGGRLRADAHLHAAVPGRASSALHAAAGDVGRDHGDRTVAALNERDFRRILSFNLVGHIGYTTASLSLMTPAALAAAIFYVLHHIVVITNLFLVSGVLLRLRRTTDMAGLGGLYRQSARCSRRWRWCRSSRWQVCRRCPVFSASSRSSKARSTAGAYWVGGIVLVVGLLTLLSMGRTWADAILEARGGGARPGHAGHAASDRHLGPEPGDAGDHRRRGTALRAHVTRRASVAAARRLHPAVLGGTP